MLKHVLETHNLMKIGWSPIVIVFPLEPFYSFTGLLSSLSVSKIIWQSLGGEWALNLTI